MHIECAEPGDEIDTDVTSLGLECIKIPEQSVHGIHYTNTTNETTGKKDITVEATVHGITSTTVGACEAENPEENVHTDGSYTGSITMSGHNELEEPVDIYAE